jgi:hypothetical protein
MAATRELAAILRGARKSALLRMRWEFLMVRSAATPRVSNHAATGLAAILRDACFASSSG